MREVKTCGECIHADICKKVNGGWFSPKNIAYCKGFKDRNNYVEVVRCKDCKHYRPPFCLINDNKQGWLNHVLPEHFCSWGERKDNERQIVRTNETSS